MTDRFLRLRIASLLCALLLAVSWTSASATTPESIWAALREPGAIVLFRHATAPGVGDPPQFRLGDCATQRNLDEHGRIEARRIGVAFRAHGVEVGDVLNSRWCRARDSASLAFPGRPKDEPAFDSFFERSQDEARSTAAARELLARWKGPGALIVFTHQVNITALTGVVPRSGQGVVVRVVDDRIEVIGRVDPDR